LPDQSDPPEPSRRPLKSRTTGWADLATRALLATPITPNQISLLGILFAGIGAWSLVQANQSTSAWWWLLAALCIQLRLLANMLDGLVAVEGGRGHPTGALYNELPDRIEDTLLLVGAGYAASSTELGWVAALLAVTCAYIRATGVALDLPADFRGPMAKPHRMAALTLACLVAFGFALAGDWKTTILAMLVTLLMIGVGTILTIIRRTVRMHQLLSAKAP
jgi:phosphatidylglycerophosphate synthase